jgi:plastocyanin
MTRVKDCLPKWRHLLLAGVLGASLASIPAVANSEPQTVEAVNEGGLYGETHRWNPSTVTVISGDTVTFRNQTEVSHGIEWRSAVTPTCTSGVPVGTTVSASGTKWSGACTFSQPGTYLYYCTVHGAAMSGTITVDANGTTTTSPPPTTTTTTTPPPSGEPVSGPAVTGSSIRSSQRGGVVKGTLKVSPAGAGGRLEVDVFAPKASLARAMRGGTLRVGRLIRGSVSAGAVAFAVKLNARAHRALKRRHRLALTVKVVFTPLHGERFLLTRHVVEHG